MPEVFAQPGQSAQEGVTFYQAFVGPGTAFEAKPGGGRSVREFTDGTGATILLVEAAEPVEWTRPADLVYDPNGPLPALGNLDPARFTYALADGTVWETRRDTPAATLCALITRNGGEALPQQALPLGRCTVSGRVTVGGAACPGGLVRFHSEENAAEVVLLGRAAADGTYHAYGLPEGAYRISVTGSPGSPVPVPPLYADPTASGLRVDVGKGEQTFDVNLSSKPDKSGPGNKQ
jgi:hypothetical protein